MMQESFEACLTPLLSCYDTWTHIRWIFLLFLLLNSSYGHEGAWEGFRNQVTIDLLLEADGLFWVVAHPGAILHVC